ncbi:branched-chain amino acid ABC transporter permease [Granulosicoccus sp.]|nr:branched-chain amino acid ABC transporter permease [Granulosicoccus sp.]
MSYLIFSASLLLIYVGLAQLLHVQFGMLGIPNFGIVGFWGMGMYGTGVLNIQYEIPFLFALIFACALSGLISYILGWFILKLRGQDVVCATLAFSAIVALLTITEKWLTEGVVGLGTIKYPIDLGKATELVYFIFLLIVILAFQHTINRLRQSGLGRLMFAIRDNEELAASLGKDSVGTKQRLFVITCTLMALLGGLSAPLNQFLTPNMLVPGMTFAVWIGLILGGKENTLGAVLGVFVTFGLFDILIETYVPVPPDYAMQVPNFKLFLYGAVLIGVLLFRPQGILARHARFKEIFKRVRS